MLKRLKNTGMLTLFFLTCLLLPFTLMVTAPGEDIIFAVTDPDQLMFYDNGHGLEACEFNRYLLEEETSFYNPPPPAEPVEEESSFQPAAQHGEQAAPAPDSQPVAQHSNPAGQTQDQSPASGGQVQAEQPQEQQQPQAQAQESGSGSSSGSSGQEQEMLRLINEARAGRGLPALQLCSELQRAARFKSKDMVDNNYFSHQSPTYSGGLSGLLGRFGISYRAAGENIAWNTSGSVDSAHTSLMNSPSHRANILGSYTHVGIGVAVKSDGSHYFTQLFVSR